MAQAEKMDAVAMLKADHRKVEDLFEKFEKATAAGQKQKLAEQICMELKIHTILEEEIFYPACEGKVEEDMLEEAYVEHDSAKVLIAQIEDSEPAAEFYDAKVKVLSEEIEHHVKEEEQRIEGMFSQARKAGLDMEALGERLDHRGLPREGAPTIDPAIVPAGEFGQTELCEHRFGEPFRFCAVRHQARHRDAELHDFDHGERERQNRMLRNYGAQFRKLGRRVIAKFLTIDANAALAGLQLAG